MKKVFIMTDFPLAKTGFGRNCKAIMEYLYKTGKYDLVNLAVGTVDGNFDIDFLQSEYNLNGVSLDEGSVLRSFGSETSLIIQKIFKWTCKNI